MFTLLFNLRNCSVDYYKVTEIRERLLSCLNNLMVYCYLRYHKPALSVISRRDMVDLIKFSVENFISIKY